MQKAEESLKIPPFEKKISFLITANRISKKIIDFVRNVFEDEVLSRRKVRRGGVLETLLEPARRGGRFVSLGPLRRFAALLGPRSLVFNL